MRSFPLAILLSCASTPRASIDVASPPAPTTTTTAAFDAGGIGRGEWRAQFEDPAYGRASCAEYTWYRRCFSVTRDECESSVATAIHACLEASTDNSTFRLIFECIMTRYDASRVAQKDPHPSCRPVIDWDASVERWP